MLIKNSLLYGLATVLKGVFGFAVIAVFTRLLTPAQYGDYAIAVSLMIFADSMAFMWVRHSVMRHITHEPSEGDAAYLSNATFIYAVVCGLCALGGAILSAAGWLLPSFNMPLIYHALAALAITEGVSNLFILTARIRQRHAAFFLLTVLKPFLALALGAAFIFGGMKEGGAVLGLLLSGLAATLWGLSTEKDFRHLSRAAVNLPAVRGICAFGLPLVMALSVQSAIRSTDRFLLEALIGGDITGLYAAAQDIPFRLLNLIAMAVHMAAYPLAVHAWEKRGAEQCKKQLAQNFTLMLGLMLPATIGMAAVAPGMAELFLGEEYRAFATQYLAVFCLIALMNCMIQYYWTLPYNFLKKNGALLVPFVIALAVDIAVALVAIPYMGAGGAALASFLAYGALLALIIRKIAPEFSMPVPPADTLKITGASLLMGGVVWALPVISGLAPIPSLVIGTALGGTIYVAAIYAMNLAGLREALHKKLKRKI